MKLFSGRTKLCNVHSFCLQYKIAKHLQKAGFYRAGMNQQNIYLVVLKIFFELLLGACRVIYLVFFSFQYMMQELALDGIIIKYSEINFSDFHSAMRFNDC